MKGMARHDIADGFYVVFRAAYTVREVCDT